MIPLTWAYAIVRYRLMDVDVIFQQGYVYTLSTVAVLGVFYAALPSRSARLKIQAQARSWRSSWCRRSYFSRSGTGFRSSSIATSSTKIVTIIGGPWSSSPAELSSETDLDHMLESVGERLIRTLSIRYVAVFLREDDRFRLHLWSGKAGPPASRIISI